MKNIIILTALFVTISTYAAYCKHCGKEATEKQLVNYACPRLKNKMKHEIFEGRKKNKYYCRICGRDSYSIRSLTSYGCSRNKTGDGKHVVFEGDITKNVKCRKCGKDKIPFKTLVQYKCPRGGYHEVLRKNY